LQLCIPNEQTGLRCIYWAYDELQGLSSLEIPGATELFGLDINGNPNINMDGEDYPEGMEKDIVLCQSYRCPKSVLMLAHGIEIKETKRYKLGKLLSTLTSTLRRKCR